MKIVWFCYKKKFLFFLLSLHCPDSGEDVFANHELRDNEINTATAVRQGQLLLGDVGVLDLLKPQTVAQVYIRIICTVRTQHFKFCYLLLFSANFPHRGKGQKKDEDPQLFAN